MKKRIIYISLFILILSINSYGFSERRLQWWEQRVENLRQELALIENKPNKIIKSILESDINTAENAIRVFNSNMLSPEDINSGTKKYTDEEIRNISGHYAEAAVNLKYLSQILKYNQFNDWNDRTRLFLQSYTYKYLSRNFPNIDESFTAAFASENMMDYYRKYLVLEAILQKSISSYSRISTAATAEITAEVIAEANKADNFLYEYQLKKITGEKISEHFKNSPDLDDFKYDEKIISASWVINTLNMHYDSKIRQYKLVSQLLEYVPADKNVSKLDYYNKRPEVLEKLSFQFFRSNLLNTEKYGFKNDGSYHPSEPDLNELYNEIDRLKTSSAQLINGFENDKTFDSFEKSFNAILNVRFKDSSLYFTAQDRSLKDDYNRKGTQENTELKPHHDGSISYDDYIKQYYNEYYNSKTVYQNKINSAKKYIKASMLYLRWLSETKNLPENSIEAAFQYRIDKNREYADFILLLDSTHGAFGEIENPDFSAEIYSIIKPETELLNTINQSLSIENRERIHLTNEKLKKLSSIRESEINKNTGSVIQLKKSRRDYYSRQAEYALARKTRDNEIKKKLAQYEINVLVDNINRYMDRYSKLNYSDEVFSSYQDKYMKLEDKCRHGIYPPELDDVFKSGSIFTLISNFNAEKMQNESEAKIYLKQSVQRDEVKIKSLLQYYKSQRIELLAPPSFPEIAEKVKPLNSVKQVKVAGWMMNEKNFNEIDRKAVLSIRQIYLKTAWNNNPQDANTNLSENPDETYKFARHGVEITIPFGWESEKLSQSEIVEGTIACFKNSNDFSEFKITAVKKSLSAQETAEKWMIKHGYSISQIGWSKINNDSVYWNISKDRKNNVIKIYSFEKDGKILLIYGISTKKMFPFFSRRFDNVINSVILSR